METATIEIENFLQPFAKFETQITYTDENGIPSIGSGWSSGQVPTISHAEFISRFVPILLSDAVKKYGRESVLRDLAELALPLYEKIDVDSMARFWAETVKGAVKGDTGESGAKPEGLRNADLAADFGIKPLFGPILDLALVHNETKVFSSDGKYFGCHAKRMGYVVRRFGIDNLPPYVELAKQLLRYDVYDWSVELEPEQWDTLAPAIEKYGLTEAYSPIIEAKCALGGIPGTKEYKYKYSFLGATVWGLMPYLLPRLMESGPTTLREDLAHIVRFIHELHGKGAFATGSTWSAKEGEFFKAFGGYLPIVQTNGIPATIESVRAHWETTLVPANQ